MDFHTVELNIAQLYRCIQKSRFNKYSDKRKATYQKTLIELFDKLRSEDFSSLTPAQLVEKKQIIDFIFESLQYLDNSTLTVIPFEIVYCLESVLNQWIPGNKFIVVTSLSNELLNYSIKGNLALYQPIYHLINNDYEKTFEYKLIQITLPRYYVHDYLANVVLYHELGHFIDMYSNISNSIANNLVLNKIIPSRLDPIFHKTLRHYMEYFADIFAAQYIGESSNYFLNYIAHKAIDSNTHPGTDERINKVNKFIRGDASDQIIQELKQYTPLRTQGQELKIRYNNLLLDDFFELIPFEIKNDTDLHSIFLSGWKVWQNTPNKLRSDFDNNSAYKIINNLIEKSISNYIVTSSWNK